MKRTRYEFENSSSSLYFEDEDQTVEGEEDDTVVVDETNYIPDVGVKEYNHKQQQQQQQQHQQHYHNHHHHNHQSPPSNHHQEYYQTQNISRKRESFLSSSTGELYIESSNTFVMDANGREEQEETGWVENGLDSKMPSANIAPFPQTTNVNMNYIWNRDNVVYVGNLDCNITEQLILKLFSTVGPISSLDLIKNRKSNKNRGICFITYHTAGEALKAVNKYDGVRILSKDIFVRLARPHFSFVLKGTGRSMTSTQGETRQFSGSKEQQVSLEGSSPKSKFKKMKSKLNDYPQNIKY